ncbi:hypothetical protein F5144DRAFT_613709 [Chaetomium tenue]|uniref:Uncharacterized protein n=1 Tax=Chaetomium tenue TaxID=1854479 RepID=A0ACB7P7G9_9PEZI|nr:hypothetical protein F5144DRAFT_613709 [Chaetomium globosum]
MSRSESPALGPQWQEVGREIYQIDQNKHATWVRVLHLTGRPTWRELLIHGKNLFDWLATNRPGHYQTETGSCLIATLCYQDSGRSWRLFQSTIPRGEWKRHMRSQGRNEAPEWYAAAYSQPRQGEFKEHHHSEDSVEYMCNRDVGTLCSRYEDPRMVVYGRKGSGGSVGKSNPCNDGRGKNPSCEVVAGLLGIRILAQGVTALDLDQRDANDTQPPPQPSSLHETTWDGPTTMSEYYDSEMYENSWGGSSSTHHARGAESSGRSRAPRPNPSSDSRGHHSILGLAGNMLGLRVGGGGGGGGRNRSRSRTRHASPDRSRPSQEPRRSSARTCPAVGRRPPFP